MGCRIIEGREAGSDYDRCCLYDSTTGWCFGPTFGSVEEAEAFITFCAPLDPRSIALDRLDALDTAFRRRTVQVTCDRCGWQFTTLANSILRGEAKCQCGTVIDHVEAA